MDVLMFYAGGSFAIIFLSLTLYLLITIKPFRLQGKRQNPRMKSSIKSVVVDEPTMILEETIIDTQENTDKHWSVKPTH